MEITVNILLNYMETTSPGNPILMKWSNTLVLDGPANELTFRKRKI